MNTYKLRILQTSDVHGYVYPRSYSTKEFENTGLGQISTLINNLRTPSTLLIDSGDTIQGSPLTYFQAKENIGTINPLTLGNHEFNYGIEYLESYLNNINAEILNSNLICKDTNKPIYGNPYKIINLDKGPKIAIIGVTTHYIPNWEQPSHIKNINFLDAFITTKILVKEVKQLENPDFVKRFRFLRINL